LPFGAEHRGTQKEKLSRIEVCLGQHKSLSFKEIRPHFI
jgi:hypothetical protein